MSATNHLSRPAGAMALAASLMCAGHVHAQQSTHAMPGGASTLIVRNNHEIPYRGPVDLAADLADGRYAGPGASGEARSGRARVFVALAAKSEVTLRRDVAPAPRLAAEHGLLAVVPSAESSAALTLRWHARSLADLALDLVVIPGDSATTESATRAFAPGSLAWNSTPDSTLAVTLERGGYAMTATARPDAAGFLDVRATVVRRGATTTAPAYVALVRRMVTPSTRADARMRLNGRELDAASPATWEGDFRYVHGVDWLRWRTDSVSLLWVNGFTPVPSVRHGEKWAEGSHFYVWELTREAGDTTYLVSEIAGPNGHQPTKGYMAVLPYAQPTQGDTVALAWRLAADATPATTWAESQLRAFAGTRLVRRDGDTVTADIGVPYTTFGISYFPYSTFAENFDFYRVPGITSEGFWATSPKMWKSWRRFVPRMRTDLHIIRAMGFDAVRLHHLELLQTLPRDEALAFLDFYAKESRALGFHWLVDTQGPPEWLGTIVGRYADLVTRVELENENLIPGIAPDEPARWTALYTAAKRAAPAAQVFLTGAGNNSMFERLRMLGVPFDRVGLHAYKHGPTWKEAFASHTLGTGGYATSIGKAATLGEFNWKDLTRLSPEARRAEFDTIYSAVLLARAIPEVFEFQFHEDLAFNTSVAGTLSRHYEPLWLDRRPKPEAFVAMALMREYGRPGSPARVLPLTIDSVRFARGVATATFAVANHTGRRVTVRLTPVAYDGTRTRLLGAQTFVLAPDSVAHGRVALSLPAGAAPGTYHHFIEASYGSGTSIGWGIAANEGAPRFADTTVLADRVTYAQGADVVRRIRWERPLAVVFGARSLALEVEQAYQLANTLQAATGRAVRISSEQDLPDSLAKNGTVLVVGTPATSALIANAHVTTTTGRGLIALHSTGGREWLLLTGGTAKDVEAAVVALELRYWPNAKDAVARVTGLEPGAALGHRAGGEVIDPP
ncbi:MAG TPA: hypothetical protein VH539_21870 [Gemmatimonadaceae bacterium]